MNKTKNLTWFKIEVDLDSLQTNLLEELTIKELVEFIVDTINEEGTDELLFGLANEMLLLVSEANLEHHRDAFMKVDPTVIPDGPIRTYWERLNYEHELAQQPKSL